MRNLKRLRAAYTNVSIALSHDTDRDIVDYLGRIPRGQVSLWVKEAIREKIVRESLKEDRRHQQGGSDENNS